MWRFFSTLFTTISKNNPMSTKKEKCCENLCYCGEDTTIGHFKGVEDCVQSESIEWEENLRNWKDCAIDAGYDFPESSFSALKSIVGQAITAAVAKAGKKAYAEGFEDGCKAH